MRGENTNLSAIGNDFIVPKPRLQPVLQVAAPAPLPAIQIAPPVIQQKALKRSAAPRRNTLLDVIHEQSVIVFALLFLAIGIAIIELGSRYIMAHDFPAISPSYSQNTDQIGGLNKTVNASDLASFMSSVASQPASLNLGSQTVNISPSVIKSWLSVSANSKAGQDYIHIDSSAISRSLTSVINQYAASPVNQVTVTRGDGSSEVALAGKNGTKLDPSVNIDAQAVTIAKNLFNNKGFSVNAPLVSVPYQLLTPSAFPKLIVSDINSKKMYLYQNGQLINTFLVSAGKPSTPTPIGEFHIWAKLSSQTMTGPGYVQPNVPWVNYFDHSGDAIHGVYWRPASAFGNVNTSHGCVGVQVSTAEYIYNWAPIGTPVITTAN